MNSGPVQIHFLCFAEVSPMDGAGFGVARVVGGDERVLAPARDAADTVRTVHADSCIPVPADLDDNRALRLPALAIALSAWERLGLELGEAAVVTSGSADAEFHCGIARWRSGRPAAYLDLENDGIAPQQAEIVSAADPQAAIDSLVQRLRGGPGAAAIVLSAAPMAADILLEAMPPWGRIGIAVGSLGPAAIDFYNRVHRSCTTLLGLHASAMSCFEPALRPLLEPSLRRAASLLRRQQLFGMAISHAR